jgi:hypothetical protein
VDKIKVTLSRRIGPFPLGIWIVIVVVGVSLGLILRKRFAGRSDDGSGSVEPAFPQDGLTGPVSGGSNPGFAPVTVTRTELVETVDREALQDLVDEIKRFVKVGTDTPVTPGAGQGDGPGRQVETPGVKAKPVDPLASFRSAVINAYQTEGVDPPASSSIARIALEVQQGRSIQHLRSSIRKNEAAQGRTTAAQSRAYWSKQTDKAGVPGV